MKKIYMKPQMEVVILNIGHSLMAGSVTESTEKAEELGSGSFGASEFFDDDDTDEENW